MFKKIFCLVTLGIASTQAFDTLGVAQSSGNVQVRNDGSQMFWW
jgi:hypothetical protein